VAERVLRACDLWTVSGAALADDALLRSLEAAGRETGHRLRILPGAFAGLDGVATAAAAPNASLHLDIDLMPGPAPAELRFSGTVRQAAVQFPNSVNVAVAAALAGPGLDAAHIDVRHPGPVERNRLALRAESAAGTFEASVQPRLTHGVHPVACNVIAALRREMQTVWVG
jgi:aspartate dehydrogenase